MGLFIRIAYERAQTAAPFILQAERLGLLEYDKRGWLTNVGMLYITLPNDAVVIRKRRKRRLCLVT